MLEETKRTADTPQIDSVQAAIDTLRNFCIQQEGGANHYPWCAGPWDCPLRKALGCFSDSIDRKPSEWEDLKD